jgi:hypothetical protein
LPGPVSADRKNPFILFSMRPAFTAFLFALISPVCLLSQCSEIDLSTLQVIEKTAPNAKENKILDLGFDLTSETGTGATNTRHYQKCWETTAKGKAIYQQVILWHTNSNDITFLTLNEASYTAIKNAINEKHDNSDGSQIVVGKMFRYSFNTQYVNGYLYYAVTIAMK